MNHLDRDCLFGEYLCKARHPNCPGSFRYKRYIGYSVERSGDLFFFLIRSRRALVQHMDATCAEPIAAIIRERISRGLVGNLTIQHHTANIDVIPFL